MDTNIIKTDIMKWLVDYIEVKTKHTNYKWPICPFAKQARVTNDIKIRVHIDGSYSNFLHKCVNEYDASDKSVVIIIFRPLHFYNYNFAKVVESINEGAILRNTYLQHGIAKNTKSKYPGIFNKGNYYFCVINELLPVHKGSLSLRQTDYYSLWSDSHWNHVVKRRDDTVTKILKENDMTIGDIKPTKDISPTSKSKYKCSICGYFSDEEFDYCPECGYKEY